MSVDIKIEYKKRKRNCYNCKRRDIDYCALDNHYIGTSESLSRGCPYWWCPYWSNLVKEESLEDSKEPLRGHRASMLVCDDFALMDDKELKSVFIKNQDK